MKKIIATLLLTLTFNAFSYAQAGCGIFPEVSVSGKITNTANRGISGALVSVYQISNGVLIDYTATNTAGYYNVSACVDGASYYLTVQKPHYQSYFYFLGDVTADVENLDHILVQ